MKKFFLELLGSLKDAKVKAAVVAYVPVVLSALGVHLLPEQMRMVQDAILAVLSLVGLFGIFYSPKKEVK